MSNLTEKLKSALNEKDVENAYRSEFLKMDGVEITSPFNVDGLLISEKMRFTSLLEFKHEGSLKNKLSQCNVLIQCLYYLKKFENNGTKLPSTIFVGDIDECFIIHTNSIIKYLSWEIDWKLAPSEAYKRNPELIKAMVGDNDIIPFVHNVDSDFNLKVFSEKIQEISTNVIRKVRITKHNIVNIYNYFEKNVIKADKLTTNEKSNLFVQIVINPDENFLHPRKKNVLVSKSFGEIPVNQNTFNSFFGHFEGDIYSPKEKEQLTALVDRLVEDTTRRNKGEFFTPTPFVDLAHKYISDTFGEDWKEKFVVWDCAWGTGNLTRDFRFKELYVSTLEQSDIDTANQMGYNMESTKFQFDFLNDSDDKLPAGLQEAINSGKEILFLINPPYATANNMGTKEGDHKGGVSDTLVCEDMKSEDWGASTRNIYAQFLYKIYKYQEKNKNIKIGIFCKPNYLTAKDYYKFRINFFKHFGFERGFLFQASHFSDVSTQWGINFAVFSENIKFEKNNFTHDLIDVDKNYELSIIYQKTLSNLDESLESAKWIRKTNIDKTLVDTIQVSSALKAGCSNINRIVENSLGYLLIKSNNVQSNSTNVALFSTSTSNRGGVSLDIDNILNGMSLFTARKTIKGDWINDKDEYLAPNENHPEYEQFTYDSIVYSLFNNSSQQSSLRQVDYKGKKWDIKNEFFWMSKEQMLLLADQNHYDALYKDAKSSDDRFVFNKLYKEGIYNKLSSDAREVLDIATELVKSSMEMRAIVSESHPEYHLDSWDAGYAQLKLVWKDYFKDDFALFRSKYKQLEDRMRPLVYELGFLKK
jgi:hypothetical protein